jgi:hypothetical protein
MRFRQKRKATTGLNPMEWLLRNNTYGTDGTTLAELSPFPLSTSTVPIRHKTALPYDTTTALNNMTVSGSRIKPV